MHTASKLWIKVAQIYFHIDPILLQVKPCLQGFKAALIRKEQVLVNYN